MNYHFDLLREPWIPAADLSGKIRHLGILDVLSQAHELKAITDSSPLVEYGLHRLLCVFLMDALRPEEVWDIRDILDKGQFDMQIVQEYVDLCIQKGASFDLFDEKRPFLQSPYNKDWDKEPKPAAYLDCTIPTGNNHVHFNHGLSNPVYSYADAAKHLPASMLFITAGAQGYPSGPNGAPPFFSLVKCNSLFNTLVHTLIPLNEIEDFDSTPVFWCSSLPVEPKKMTYKTSWLYGMLFPSRRILLIPDDDGVRGVYFSQGMNFCVPENWTDPHVTYRYGNEGRFPWRPNGEKAVWRNLNDLIDISGKHAPKILHIYEELHSQDADSVRISLYGVQTSNASFLDVFYHDLQIPLELVTGNYAPLIGACIQIAEDLARQIKYSLECEGLSESLPLQAMQMCYHRCESALWTLCYEDISADKLDGNLILGRWKLTLCEIGRSVTAGILEKLSLPGTKWLRVYELQESLNRYLAKLKKEGTIANGTE